MTRNRLFFIAAAMFTSSSFMWAQTTSYEAVELFDADLGGTARYVGMGGAMSALGADMSAMSTNPAAIGLYRSWDMALSVGGNWDAQFTKSNSNQNRSFDSYATLDNAGIVIAGKKSNENMLRFVNFGFNYRNVKRFDGKMGMSSSLPGISQVGQMARQAFDAYNYGIIYPSDFDEDAAENFYKNNFYDGGVGWLTLLGAAARLINGNALDNGSYDLCFSDACNYVEWQYGGINAYDFNLSFNLADAVYLGATFTTYEVDRGIESIYTEYFANASYTLENFYRTVGTGYDLKLGVILRPFAESSFRFGVSATTPTIFDLTDYSSAIISSTEVYVNEKGEEWTPYMDTQFQKAYNGDYISDYTMISPAKLNVSLGSTVGTSLALGAEYEYSDYGKTRLFDRNGNESAGMNEHTNAYFSGHHIVRLGAEKLFGSFYTRLGYNFQMGGYNPNAYKMIYVDSQYTNTAYKNIRSTNNYTCGVGFRGDVFYADAALLYSHQTADFYPFDDLELEATSLSRNLLKGMVTVGLRF